MLKINSFQLSDFFDVQVLKSGKSRVKYIAEPRIFMPFIKGVFFYTIYNDKKVYYQIIDGKETLIEKEIKDIFDIHDFTERLRHLIAINHDQLPSDLSVGDYMNAYFVRFRGIPLKLLKEWVVERKCSPEFEWALLNKYSNREFRKRLNTMFMHDLEDNGFKSTIDESNTFHRGYPIYYKEISPKKYVMFCFLGGYITIDARLGEYASEDQIGKQKMYNTETNSFYRLSYQGLTYNFDPSIHYPLMKGLIKSPEKYNFFHQFFGNYEKASFEKVAAEALNITEY